MPRAKNYQILAMSQDSSMTLVDAGPFYTEKAAAAHVRNSLPSGEYQIVRLYSTETSNDNSTPAIKTAISAEAIAESPLPPSFLANAKSENTADVTIDSTPKVEFVDTDEIF